jgi:hypothetical protein
MVLYTPDAATALGSANAAQAKAGAWIANLNTCLSNSSLGSISATLVHTQQVTQNFGQNGHSQALQYLGSDTTVTSLRDTHKADLVSIMIQGAANGAGTVGLGHVLMNANGSPGASCTSVWHSGQDETFSHEIGHNHGCGHDATQGGSKLNAESQGYHFTGSDGKGYRTVMAYGKTGFNTRIQYFSGPSIIYKGSATGVSGSADNAKTIGTTNPQIQNYRK